MKLSLLLLTSTLLTSTLQASMITIPMIPVTGHGTFMSFANMDGGYTAYMSGNNGINRIELSISISPPICCVFYPGLLNLSGGMIPSGIVHIDNMYSNKFLFTWDHVEVFNIQTGEPMMWVPLNGTLQETSFNLTGEGYQRVSTGTFDIGVPESETTWLITIGLVLLCIRKLTRFKLSSFSISNYFS